MSALPDVCPLPPSQLPSFAAPSLPRLFVGLDLPPPAAASLQSLQSRPNPISGARWIPPRNWHITLHFLGKAELEDVQAALERVRAAPFTLSLREPGTFSGRGRPYVLWAGVPPTPGLAALHAAVGDALAGAGFCLESRPYNPHVSLAKLKCCGEAQAESVHRFVRQHSTFESPAFRVDAFTLFESVSRHGSLQYVSKGRYSLSQEKEGAA